MKTSSFILISFVILQIIFDFGVLCFSTQYVLCNRIYNDDDYNRRHYSYKNEYILEGKLTLICSNDSQQIDLLNQNSAYFLCSDHYNDGESVQKQKIRQVNIENCQMSKLSIKYDIFGQYTRLQELNISHIGLETLEKEIFTNATSLKKLNASHNKIQEIPVQLLNNAVLLNEIDFSYNQIKRLHSFFLPDSSQLVILDFSNNQIETIDKDAFDNMTNLNKLNLTHNPIGFLNIGTFSKLKNLQYLNLSDTNLVEIRLGTFSHTRQLVSLDLSWNQLKTIDFSLFLPKFSYLNTLYLNENHLTDLEGFSNTLLPQLNVFGIARNNFNCSYLKNFLNQKIWEELTFFDDYLVPVNPHEMNIHGINCEEVNENETNSSVIIIDASTTTTTTITTIKYDAHEDVKIKQENFSNFDTKQLTISLTDAFSLSSQALFQIKSVLICMCFVLSMLLIIVLIIIFINRDRILHIPRYRGFSRKGEGQSKTCISNDYEVSTFSHENTA